MPSRWGRSVWALTSVLALGACDEDREQPLYCYEYIPGESVGTDIGGTPSSYVQVQATSDYALVAATSTRKVAVLCTQIAIDLGAKQADIDEASSSADMDERASKACKVATDAVKLRLGSTPVTFPAVTCSASSALQTSCERRCLPASAECTFACATAARARAECPEPMVQPGHFGELLALRARLLLMTDDAPTFYRSVIGVTDIRAGCIPRAVAGYSSAAKSVSGALSSTTAVIAAAEGK